MYKREQKQSGYFGHGGALVTEYFDAQHKMNKPASAEARIERVRAHQREVLAKARATILAKLPPHLLPKDKSASPGSAP